MENSKRMEDSKRIKNLKDKLIKEIPFYPNNKEAKAELESQCFEAVLLHYLYWQSRLVPSRIRKVEIAPEVTSDKRWETLRDDIGYLLDLIRKGMDVCSYLSSRAHCNGYTPFPKKKDGKDDSWEDKDQLLNLTGFHHFHLKKNTQNARLSERTDDVLLALVRRETFRAIGIFNHSVFDSEEDCLNEERSRMWDLCIRHASAIFGNRPVSLSSHPMDLVFLKNNFVKKLRKYDPKLDDRKYVNKLYDEDGLEHPSKFNFEWQVNALDLVAYDRKTGKEFSFVKGFI